jgi:flavin-dependent dehydrogenase
MRVDAVIVGARCAGSATALLLARAGARVLLVDKSRYGTDALSTHALMRGGILQLHRWGVLPAIVAAGTPPVRSTTFAYATGDVTVAIEPKFGVDALYAPRRAILDRVLADAAAESGAEIEYGVRVEDVIFDHRGRACGVVASNGRTRTRIEAGLVIGADGLHSTIAARVNAATLVAGRHSSGILYSYWEDVPAEGYYWAFREASSMGAIPTNGGATCVFASVPSARFGVEFRRRGAAAYRPLLLEASPAFEGRLAWGHRVEPVRSFLGEAGFIKRSIGPGWALVGDAGYFKDPLSAHGITDALRDAELLVRAISEGSDAALVRYEEKRLDLSQTLFEVTDEIASFAWDVDRVQALHRSLSIEMSRETRAIAELAPLPSRVRPHGVLQAV